MNIKDDYCPPSLFRIDEWDLIQLDSFHLDIEYEKSRLVGSFVWHWLPALIKYADSNGPFVHLRILFSSEFVIFVSQSCLSVCLT